jgi:hypothetical protein
MKKSSLVVGLSAFFLLLAAATVNPVEGIHETDSSLLQGSVKPLVTTGDDFTGLNGKELSGRGPLIIFLAANALVGFLLLRRI